MTPRVCARRVVVTDAIAKAKSWKSWALSESVNLKPFAHWARGAVEEAFLYWPGNGALGASNLPKNI